MDARRIRNSMAAIVVFALIAVAATTPAAAADGCSIVAPYALRVGDPLSIVGAGFPASTTIDVSMTLADGSTDSFTVDSNATGGFQISLTPENADIGTTTIVASAGTTCSATAAYTVVGASATLPPEPAATAGSDQPTGGSGDGATAPRTEMAGMSLTGRDSNWQTAWGVSFISLLIGLGGLIATRPARNRSGRSD
jgi:hypothetical protein